MGRKQCFNLLVQVGPKSEGLQLLALLSIKQRFLHLFLGIVVLGKLQSNQGPIQILLVSLEILPRSICLLNWGNSFHHTFGCKMHLCAM
eukprot:383495-Ditylum_brightwellii.AAC.1